ncbi:sensor histidine kinase [Dictyobacter formicarum]|uniref:histidine kinase n=1 Tax=Dictyobacter formicarum TaxID=2778368 RepID=A0ABQ3VPB7_9CHLR|nr:ATP-binding protein [Dictyobacter formicarum]GHO88097.1 sensor histidine kinase [Dictyobacter formicarum]
MGKSQRHVVQRKQRPDVTSARKHGIRSTPLKVTAKPRAAQNETVLFRQLEAIFAVLPDGVVACDQDGKILRLNAAALRLFEVSSEARYRGRDYRDFLAYYTLCNEQQRPIFPEAWLRTPSSEEATSSPPEQTLMLQTPSKRRVAMNVSCSPVLDAQKHVRGMVAVFHEISQRDQQARHLQRVHEAVLTMTKAIAHLPENLERFSKQVAAALPEGSLLLSPPVIFIAQQLVNVIHQVLDCPRASLKALDSAGYYYYVAGSGFTAEQEEPERATSGLFTASELLAETVIARLCTNKEAIVRGDRVHYPPGFDVFASESYWNVTILLIPLFFEQQLSGVICIIKPGVDSIYTPEEIELVKVVSAQAMLVMEYLHCLHQQIEARNRELVLHEINRLNHDFLILANHELRTPLTGILGNLQLAQRRLELLKHEGAAQAERVSEQIVQAQQPLETALRSARVQQRMIDNITDDARIQTNQLELHLQRRDLLALLKAAVATRQQLVPERTIVLEMKSAAQEVPVIADAERITQVLTTYLTNALAYSPNETPVTIQVTIEEGVARVSVHNEGPGIPSEEQTHLWERFYRAKGNAVQHEMDLSLGLGLYLCRALIERHTGNVGVQSVPGHGATFWFTLPIAPSLGGREHGNAP